MSMAQITKQTIQNKRVLSEEHPLFHAMNIKEVLKILRTNEQGLSEQEVAQRKTQYGLNTLPEPKTPSWVIFFARQFRSPLIYVLLAAAIISFVIGEYIDMYVIFAAVFINVILGFIQEGRAQRALEKLRTVISTEAKVMRFGKEKIIPSRYLVPGDVVFCDAGEKVPADIRLFSIFDLEVNEAALTVESTPVTKDTEKKAGGTMLAERNNMIFTGTVITKGSCRGIVTATGVATEMGQIATLLKETKEDLTPLQKKLSVLSRRLAIIIVVIGAGITLIGIAKGIAFFEIFIVAIALAVAAIPEGLIVAVTVVLAIGMQRILRYQGLVRKLLAAETLGSTTVICTDKTGTLTEGKMQVVKVITWDQNFDVEKTDISSIWSKQEAMEDYRRTLTVGVVSNNAVIANPDDDIKDWNLIGNLTDRALLLAGIQLGLDAETLKKQFPRIAEIPFDSALKFMATLHRNDKKGNILFVKGAPEKILDRVHAIYSTKHVRACDASARRKLQRKFQELSKKGLRILAFAYKEVGTQETNIKVLMQRNDFIFLSFVAIKDPLRPQARDTILQCRKAGITSVMITGDHRFTAQAIARELNIPAEEENILEGTDLLQLSDAALRQKVKKISVYARVTPQDKLRIIQAWQAHHAVVAMTGDGINDSPALKAADIGVALGSGTEVAKEAADLVILDDDFQTIVVAVEEGRGIYDNIKKIVLYLLSDSFSEIILVTGSILIGSPLPLLASQILWINLVTDGFPNLALTLEPKEKKIMEEKPVSRKEPIPNRESVSLIALISAVTGIGNLLLFLLLWKSTKDITLARSVIFASLGVDSLLYVFSIRSLRQSIFKQKLWSNPYLLLAIMSGFILQICALYIPFFQRFLETVALGFREWGIVILLSATLIVIIECFKWLFRRIA